MNEFNNMGCMSKEQIERFAHKVLKDFSGWTMMWSACSGGMCYHKTKRIAIPERMIGKYPWEAKEYVLHEAAHISLEGCENQGHGELFYKNFGKLVLKFLAQGKGDE